MSHRELEVDTCILRLDVLKGCFRSRRVAQQSGVHFANLGNVVGWTLLLHVPEVPHRFG